MYRCKKKTKNYYIKLSNVYIFQAGIYWITFLDQFTGSYPAFVIGFFECICIAYVYGMFSNGFFSFFEIRKKKFDLIG